MTLFKKKPTSLVPNALQHLGISFHSFELNRCDKKTFYITVELYFNGQKVLCDLIYIVDQPEMCGAISINTHYHPVQRFIKQHFNHHLMYSDEMKLAKNFSQTSFFKQSMKQFAEKYPEFAKNSLTYA
ncbi:hypothetical protein AEA09_12665 [Lysinibacillus contaminans]|uniref:Uncharacterized protein n=1 Tax=Lysinibacillus contaminans TaxID=1293441 RepID=A0ABR5K358_9BACI|nr:hypothetical protein [Lysinibacillus contaminans]KOS69328.1 hypothetical protein AEA09_12665 [Lysinibacillus contaminans]